MRFASPYQPSTDLTQSIRSAGSRTGLCPRGVKDWIMSNGCDTGCHAEHVGSLLRPPTLLEARERHAVGHMSTTRLCELEDDAALSAIAAQRDAVRFASTARGNLLTEDDQRRKLELVAEVSDQVWGS